MSATLRTWILDSTQGVVRLICFQGKKILFCDADFPAPHPHYGAIYTATVSKAPQNSSLAFLNLEGGYEAVLPMAERDFPRPVEGEKIQVQITREADPDQNKLAIAARTIERQVGPLMEINMESGLRFSKKIPAEMRERLTRLMPEAPGILVRSHAQDFSETEILGCLDALKSEAPEDRFVQNILNLSTPQDTIQVDSLALFQRFSKAIQGHPYAPQLVHQRDGTFDENLEDAWTQMFSTHVPIPGGGDVIIEKTHALMAIDVNTGETTLPKSAFLKKALEVIFEEIRKRDLGGIILVDLPFSLKDQGDVLSFAKKAAQLDLNPPKIHGITNLGILEISRKVRGLSFLRRWHII